MTTKTHEEKLARIQEIEDVLARHYGTHEYHRYPLSNLVYTDGIQAMAEVCGAYWLIGVVASYQSTKQAREESFQLWRLRRTDESAVVVDMRGDIGWPVAISQDIELSDFPLDEFECYVVHDGPNVIMMLKSEY